MKFKSKIVKLDSSVWSYALEVPDAISSKFQEFDRRVILKLSDGSSMHAALLPRGGKGFFINMNKEIRKRLKVDVGDEIEVEISYDKSKYGIFICEEFEAILEQEILGSKYFHALTIGKQRSLIYLASKAKSSDTRISKGIAIIEYLKSSGGKLDFKELNQFMRDNKF